MSSLLVFPGQGAQRPGMLQQMPASVLDEASDALVEDVRQLDSAHALASTRAVQLCLLIAGVALLIWTLATGGRMHWRARWRDYLLIELSKLVPLCLRYYIIISLK
jgi:hypothetical protein